MKRRSELSHSHAAPLVRWEFEREHRHLMCAINATPAGSSFEVVTVPLRDVGRTAVETLDSPARRSSAMRQSRRTFGRRVGDGGPCALAGDELEA